MKPANFQDYYSRPSQNTHNLWCEFDQVQADWLLNRLKILFNPESRFSLLHLACGDGGLLTKIGEIFPNASLHGYEENAEAIRTAQRKLKSRAVLTQAPPSDFTPHHHYDVILSTCCLHKTDSPSDHLQTLKAAVKQDRHLFISEVSLSTWPIYLRHLLFAYKNKGTHYAWGENDFRYLLKSCGLTISNGAILKPDNFWRIQMYHVQNDPNHNKQYDRSHHPDSKAAQSSHR